MKNSANHKWWALGALTLAVLAVGLDGTILSVALPTLATSLHASESDLQWFTSGYLLVLAAAMLPAGMLGDRYGRKKVMLSSLVLFGAGSAACAYASSPAWFIAARTILGVAGAGIIVMALSALTVLFTEAERPRAVGVWAAANFVSLPIGPILGGWLLTHYWWGWVFLMNVPVALIGFIAAFIMIPESRAPERPAIDLIGIVSSVVGLATLTYGLIEAGQRSWGDIAAVVPMIAGVIILFGFFLWERRLTLGSGGQPLVDLALFRSAAFTWGVILSSVAVLAMIGVLFTMPQYFQAVLGTDAMGSGLRLLPLIGGLMVGALLADRLAVVVGIKVTATLGFVLLAIGLFIGSLTSSGSTELFVAMWMTIVGVGMGFAMATSASAALAEIPTERSGVGSAVMQAMNKVGGPFGAAILGSALNSAYLARLELGNLPAQTADTVRSSVFGGVAVAQQTESAALLASVRDAFIHGMDVALVVSAGFAVAGIVLALAFLPRRTAEIEETIVPRVESAHETAD
ncbi:MAG: DHA2 family efflux MFS transporter permease subunit [Nitrolancea sp.]